MYKRMHNFSDVLYESENLEFTLRGERKLKRCENKVL
jgi:hypothetical protein